MGIVVVTGLTRTLRVGRACTRLDYLIVSTDTSVARWTFRSIVFVWKCPVGAFLASSICDKCPWDTINSQRIYCLWREINRQIINKKIYIYQKLSYKLLSQWRELNFVRIKTQCNIKKMKGIFTCKSITLLLLTLWAELSFNTSTIMHKRALSESKYDECWTAGRYYIGKKTLLES